MPRRHSYSVREAANEHEIVSALHRATRGYGQVIALARKLGVSRQYLDWMIYGKGRVSVQVAQALGFELRWVRKEDANALHN